MAVIRQLVVLQEWSLSEVPLYIISTSVNLPAANVSKIAYIDLSALSQIAVLLHAKKNNFELHIQAGSSDCGLFAIVSV